MNPLTPLQKYKLKKSEDLVNEVRAELDKSFGKMTNCEKSKSANARITILEHIVENLKTLLSPFAS